MDIEKIIADRIGVDVSEVTDEKHLVEDLGSDSLSIVEIIMDIEEHFDVTISDEEAEKLDTVGLLKEWVGNNT